jgi:hypothetical protein
MRRSPEMADEFASLLRTFAKIRPVLSSRP